MAKRRRSTPRVSKSGGTTIVTMPAQSAPVTRRRRSGGRRAAPRRVSRRRSRGGGGLGGSGPNRMIGYAVGGFAVGFLEKTFPNLPTLPIVGKKGAIAIAAYLLRAKHPIITDIGMAAAAISGYELGSAGHITGSIMGGGVASQM